MSDNQRRMTGRMYVFFGVSFLIGVLALIDWALDGATLEYAASIWEMIPYLVRLSIVCIVSGVAVVFAIWGWLIHSAVPVDENECPIQVKGKK